MRHPTFRIAVAAACWLLLVAALAAPPAAAVAPRGKHYAGVLVGRAPDGTFVTARGCVTFARRIACTEEENCGQWRFVGRHGSWNMFQLRLEFEEDGIENVQDARGLTERRGPRSSVAGTLYWTVGGVGMNAAFAGSEARTLTECLEWGRSDD